MNPNTPRSDADLVTALRAGDPSAYEQLVRDYGGRMLAVCERLLFNHEDARDAVQEAFFSAFRSIPSFDGRSQFATWLHRIAINAALMKLRSKRRHPEQSIDDLLPRFLTDGHRENPGPRWAGSINNLVETRETQQLIRDKIEALPESYRNVLILRDIEELDTETVAELLGLTPGAVKVRLHRARQALRALLEPIFGKPSK
jgi:RNA polymerase sigma-70 factor (ECF subfamily)